MEKKYLAPELEIVLVNVEMGFASTSNAEDGEGVLPPSEEV